jgi:hypothetical protein
VCGAVHQLCAQYPANQTLFGEAGIALGLKRALQEHPLDLSATRSALCALHALMSEHHFNCTQFAAIATPRVLLDLLAEYAGETEVMKDALWVLACVRTHSPNKLLVVEEEVEEGGSNASEGDERLSQGQAEGEGVLALTRERVRAIVSAIRQHPQDACVCKHGCALLCSLLVWSDRSSSSSSSSSSSEQCVSPPADGRVFLLNDTHALLTGYFLAAGACEVVAGVLSQHGSDQGVCSSALHAAGLLLRPLPPCSSTGKEDRREDSTRPFGSVQECEMVLRMVHRFGGSSACLLGYAALLLGNVLYACPDPNVVSLIGGAGAVRELLQLLTAAVADPGAARYGSVLVTRLSEAGGDVPGLLLQEGVCGFLLGALHTHPQAPAVIEHALNALSALCLADPAASDQLGASDACQALAAVFTDFPAAAEHQPVAFSLARAVACLAEGNGNNCLKLGKVGACEDVVKQLIHFLNGSYIAIIRDTGGGGGEQGQEGQGQGGRAIYCELVALWSCRAIGCLARDPATYPPRPGQVQATGGGFNENRVTLGDVGACEAIAQVLKKYSGHEDVTQWALWAALHLSAQDEANSAKLGRAGVGKCVTAAAEHFPANASVQAWATEVLSQLLEGAGAGK